MVSLKKRHKFEDEQLTFNLRDDALLLNCEFD